MTVTQDYHQYVFHNQKLVGKFEEMYQKCAEVPWQQDQTPSFWWTKVAKQIIQLHAPYEWAVDVGCGLGYFTHEMAGTCFRMHGLDVSPTAIHKAKELFPQYTFEVADLRTPLTITRQYDLVVVKDLMWYVFPQFEQVLANIRALCKPDGTLFVFQCFPPLENRFIGHHVIPNPAELFARFADGFQLQYQCTCQEYHPAADGPMTMGLFRANPRLHNMDELRAGGP